MQACLNKKLKTEDKFEKVDDKNLIKNAIIIDQFHHFILNSNRAEIANLLLDTGEYNIQNKLFETISVGKAEFINWLSQSVKNESINSVYIDQCLFCKTGNPVFIINGGSFPRKVKSSAEMFITGLMIDIQQNKISSITFCYNFLHTENDSIFNINIKKVMELEKNGLSRSEASIQILGFDLDNVNF